MPLNESPLRDLSENLHLQKILQPLDFIDGLLVGVASVPEIPMPHEWLPLIFKVHGQLPDAETADALADIVMAQLKEVLKAMRDEASVFPSRFSLPLSSENEDAISLWCQGLMFAHGQFEPVWAQAWDKMASADEDVSIKLEKDLKHCLKMFTTFADIKSAKARADAAGNDELISKLPQVSNSLPVSVETYAALAGKLATYLPNQFETFAAKP